MLQMPINRFNSTGRQRIMQRHIQITIASETKPAFTAQLELGSYSLPETAPVRVEAYRGEHTMRFDFGTVGQLTDAAKKQTLGEFTSAKGLLFRVLVIDPGASGRLLAITSGIHSSGDRDQAADDTLLPVVPGDLGQETWRVELREGGPHLVINQNLRDWEGFAAEPGFRALVYPAALRYVLRQIRDEEAEEEWAADWLDLARSLGVPVPAQAGDDDWIDNVARAFSDQHALFDGLRRADERDLEQT